nr:sigma 54-interacting transcriptional regulator [Microbacterium yannicii]
MAIAVDQIRHEIAQVAASNPVVLIDGRSGAGKSSLARALVARWPLRGRVQVVALDSIYPGWDGLDDGVELARELILRPHARGLVGVWQRWDWTVGEPAEAHAVDPSLPLIVEGAGLLTPATARLGDVRVWLESPAASRKQRALARDGDGFRPHWERWAAQERQHVARDDPMRLATLVIPVP